MYVQITRNIDLDRYVVTYEGITYYFPYELLNSVKSYYNNFRGTIDSWYEGLTWVDKRKVRREGLPPEKSDFYPDTQVD